MNKNEIIKELYPSAKTIIPAFHVSLNDARQIFIDNGRWDCDDCYSIYIKSKTHDGRVIISNYEEEGLHLIGLSNL